MQALKLAPRDPRLPLLADKIRVKDIVRATLGEEWLIPTLWTGKTLPAAPLWELPVVVKANHGSGWFAAYLPGHTHWPDLVKNAAGWLKTTYGRHNREWHYAHIEPCLLVEPFIGERGMRPIDYKFYVFNGRAEYVLGLRRPATTNGYQGAYYNLNWERQPFPAAHCLAEGEIERPASLEAMTAAAERLAEGFEFVRVDFYEVGGRPKFGEMTFFPGSGMTGASQTDLDEHFGELWAGSGA